jgi:hypothetical protein
MVIVIESARTSTADMNVTISKLRTKSPMWLLLCGVLIIPPDAEE